MTESNTREKRKDQKAQSAAFRKAARELGCDDSEERFQEALRTIAKPKPTDGNRAVKRAPGK
jgi:hypothetical protein